MDGVLGGWVSIGAVLGQVCRDAGCMPAAAAPALKTQTPPVWRCPLGVPCPQRGVRHAARACFYASRRRRFPATAPFFLPARLPSRPPAAAAAPRPTMSNQQVSTHTPRSADMQPEDELAPTRTEGYKVSPLRGTTLTPAARPLKDCRRARCSRPGAVPLPKVRCVR